MKASEALGRPGGPGEPDAEPGRRARGCAGAPDRARRSWTRPTSASRRSPPPWRTRRPSGCRPRPRATPRATCSRRPTRCRPSRTAVGLITQMVAKTVEAEQSLDIESKAKALGLTPEQVLTVASILEYEANRSEDYPKVARVLYNRLDEGHAAAAGLDGRLRQQAIGRRVDDRGGAGRTPRRTTPTSTPGCLRGRSGRRARRRSRRRSTRPTATGSTSSRTTRTTPPASPRRYAEHQKWVDEAEEVLPVRARTASEPPPGMRCAVLGSPIAHSLSPALHRAAYADLGLDWTYDAVEVDSAGLRGLHRAARRDLARAVADDAAEAGGGAPGRLGRRVGAARRGGQHGRARRPAPHGYNTDVPGAVSAVVERVPAAGALRGGDRRRSHGGVGAARPRRARLPDRDAARAGRGARRGDRRSGRAPPPSPRAVGLHDRRGQRARGGPRRLHRAGCGADTGPARGLRRHRGRLRGRLRPVADPVRAGSDGLRTSVW